MQNDTFRYSDSSGKCVTRTLSFSDDREALDAASILFEPFYVQVVCGHNLIGAFAWPSDRPIPPEIIIA